MEIVRARRRGDSVTSNNRTLIVYAPAPGGYATTHIEGSDLPSGACTEACDTELASTKEPVASPLELISPNPGAAGRIRYSPLATAFSRPRMCTVALHSATSSQRYLW